jgi:head-tail adaptor
VCEENKSTLNTHAALRCWNPDEEKSTQLLGEKTEVKKIENHAAMKTDQKSNARLQTGAETENKNLRIKIPRNTNTAARIRLSEIQRRYRVKKRDTDKIQKQIFSLHSKQDL